MIFVILITRAFLPFYLIQISVQCFSSNIEFIWFFIKSLICKAMSLYIPTFLEY